jgi:hypothetical protein
VKKMLGELYSRWMYRWETALTTRDTNRIVRPVEWGFDWLEEFTHSHGFRVAQHSAGDHGAEERTMLELNDFILQHKSQFFAYQPPQDFALEERHPQLFPTNVRPETLQLDARMRQRAADGSLAKAKFLRFTSPVRTPYPENDRVNARWFPATPEKMAGKPKQAIIVMPHWNADAFSHNALCSLFARFGVSALRLSKPYHDIRRPAELERADYAVSANVGRTIASCRQAVVDIRCCLDWLQQQGYEQFGILGTSLGSCYAFLASALDSRIRVTAFNHASMSFGDVVWTGQSTRHIRAAFEAIGMTHQRLSDVWAAISPSHYMDQFAASPRKILLVHATYDLTFLEEYSLQVIENFRRRGIDFVSKVLPCGHYTTGETPFKFMDGWYLGSFVYSAFKQLATLPAPSSPEKQLVAR